MRRILLPLLALPLLIGATEDPRTRMRAAEQAAAAAEANVRTLDARASAASDAAARARAEAAALAGRVQAAEAAVAAADARVATIDDLRRRQRDRLAERQGDLVNLIAALQTMARRPPALALVSRGSLDDAIRTRSLLDAVLPEVRRRTAGLSAEVAAGNRLRASAATAASAAAAARTRLDTKRRELVALEDNQRRAAADFATRAVLESDRALALGVAARDLGDLGQALDRQAALRRQLETLPGPKLRPRVPEAMIAALPRDVAPAPLAAPPSMRLRLPALGEVVTGFGELSDAGVRARGITLATQPRAQVVAPAAGRVAYAGTFRTYGRIVIIEHDGDWTSLITGLGTVAVSVGQQVDAGGPIGTMAAASPELTVEVRRDGAPVDPLPLMLAESG